MNTRFKMGAALVAGALLLLAACSSSSDDSGSSTGDTSAAAQAQEIVSVAEVRPTEIAITQPITGSIPEGGTLYFVQCGAPACVELGDVVEEVADRIGWSAVRINAGLTPETIKNAWQQVVSSNPTMPSGVIASGFPRSIFESELQQLASRGIPVVNLSVNDEVGDGMTAVIGDGNVRNVEVGKLQAAWTIADSGGAADTVFVRVAGFPTQVPQSEAFTAEYSRLCPSCSQDLLEVPTESMGTTLPQDLAAYLQANPNVTHVVMSYGDMAIGVPQALRNAGMGDRVRIVTDTPNPTVAQYIADENIVIASTAYPGPEMIYTAVDIILRVALAEDYAASANAPLPEWILTSENIPSTTVSFPIVERYQDQFDALWGLR